MRKISPVHLVLSIPMLLFAVALMLGINIIPAYAENQESYDITFQDETSISTMQSVLQNAGVIPSKVFEDYSIATATLPESKVSELKQNSQIISVTKDRKNHLPGLQTSSNNQSSPTPLTLTDPLYLSHGWPMRRLKANLAWDMGKTSSHATVVAIIDTGVAVNHPDLAANIVYEKCFSSFQPICNTYPTFPSNQSGNHGTVVAGVLGAVIDGQGMIGVAPNVGIASYNVGEVGPDGIPMVADSSIWAAMADAATQKFEIINFSAGEVFQLPLSPEDQETVNNWNRVLKKINKKGLVMFASAGNEGLNLNDPNVLMVPCELDNVLCVGATNIRPQAEYPFPGSFDEPAFYTSYGAGAVDFVAPGGDCGGPDFNTCLTVPNRNYFIWTTTVSPNPTCALTKSCPVSYTASIGTSFSSPLASGVAALVMDAYKAKTGKSMKPEKVAKVLSKTAEKLTAYPQLGAGMLNAEAAVQEAIKMAKDENENGNH